MRDEYNKTTNSVIWCKECKCSCRPNIVFFDEQLSERYRLLAEQDLRECDMLLVMGTSLKVTPVASMIEGMLDAFSCIKHGMAIRDPNSFGLATVSCINPTLRNSVAQDIPRVLVNKDPIALAGDSKLVDGLTGFYFNDAKNFRDVFLKGQCDAISYQLATRLGWQAELDALLPGNRTSTSEPVAHDLTGSDSFRPK